MRKVIVCKDLNYAASKTSGVNGSATLSFDLAEGAVGIYGIPKTSTNNKDKMALVTNGGSDAAGKVPDASFDGDAVQVSVGVANGVQSSWEVWPAGKTTVNAIAFTAAVYQVSYVGYDNADASKSFNTGTVEKNDTADIKITDTENLDQGGNIRTESINFNVKLNANESGYLIASKLSPLINEHPKQWVTSKIVAVNVAGGTNLTNSAAVTNNSKTVVSTAHAVDANDFISIDGDLYIAAAIPDANTITLDRVYQGPTNAALANTLVKDVGTASGAIGIQMTSLVLGRNFGVSVDEVLVDADITYAIGGTYGEGESEVLKEIELEALGYKGSTSGFTDATMPVDKIHTVDGVNYDVYVFNIKNPHQEATGGTAKQAHDLYGELLVAFPDGGSNDGQSDFEAVMGQVLYGAANLGGIA